MLEKQKNFILTVDLLGFENWVCSTPLENVLQEYAQIITGTEFSAQILQGENYEFFVYSDTLVVIIKNQDEDVCLMNLVRCANMMQSHQYYLAALGHPFRPMRGTITYGEFIYHNGDIWTQAHNRPKITARNVDIFFGKPVIAAYHLEKQMQIMAIIIDDSAAERLSDGLRDHLLGRRHLVRYPIPLKDGGNREFLICSPVNKPLELVEGLINRLRSEMQEIKEDANTAEKYSNTIALIQHIKDNDLFYPSVA